MELIWGLHHTLDGRQSLKLRTWWVVRALSILSERWPSSIACCSPSARLSHIRHGFSDKRMIVIENGVNTREFAPDPTAAPSVRRELGIGADAKLVGMLARYHAQKDHGTMLLAAEYLHAEDPDVHFLLAGEGVDASNRGLSQQVYDLGLGDCLHLLGARRDAVRLQAALNVATLTSSHGEAMPRSIAESMACGVPCVATAVGDTGSLIADTGIVVDPRDARGLARAWATVLNLPAHEYVELSRRARDRIVEHYNLHSMVDKYRGLYRSLAPAR